MPNKENAEPREGFVFLRSFYESAQYLSQKNRWKLYEAFIEYGLNGKIPEDLSRQLMSIFVGSKRNVDSSIKNYKNKVERSKKKNSLDFEQNITKSVRLPKKEDEETDTFL